MYALDATLFFLLISIRFLQRKLLHILIDFNLVHYFSHRIRTCKMWVKRTDYFLWKTASSLFHCARIFPVSLIARGPQIQVKLRSKWTYTHLVVFSRGNTIKTSGPINVVLSFSLMAGQISVAARNLGVRYISWTTPQIPSPNIPYTMYICDPFNLNFVGIGGFLFRTDSYRFYGYFYMSIEYGKRKSEWVGI